MAQFFWLDSNVLMEAHRRYYGFDIAPGFWASLETHARADKLRSPQIVLDVEIAPNKDALCVWAKAFGKDLFVQPTQAETQEVGQITQYVLKNFTPAAANFFLAKADPWVIAHALVNKGIVVTQEILAGANSKKVKIPNVCNQFNVSWIDTFELLRRLKVILT